MFSGVTQILRIGYSCAIKAVTQIEAVTQILRMGSTWAPKVVAASDAMLAFLQVNRAVVEQTWRKVKAEGHKEGAECNVMLMWSHDVENFDYYAK